MVRAGVVKHPSAWKQGGYQEIQQPPKRYRMIDVPSLMSLIDIKTFDKFQKQHRQWVDEEIAQDRVRREKFWTESLAVGDEAFIKQVQTSFGDNAEHRNVEASSDKYILREMPEQYTSNVDTDNDFEWDIS